MPAQDERGVRWTWVLGAIWLVYLGGPLERSLHAGGLRRPVVGVTCTVAFAAVYLALLVVGQRRRQRGAAPLPWAWLQLAVLVGLEAGMVLGAHDDALSASVFLGAFTMFGFSSTRVAWAVTAVVALTTEGLVLVVPGWHDNGNGFAVPLAAAAVFAMRLAAQRNQRLHETREEMAQLAVSEERSRFARDLHDILGHSLTVIAVKAELAGRLLDADPERARNEVADLERLARAALGDVRGAVAGIREVTLSGELVSARFALVSAGIEPDLPTAVDHVPGALRELFGWAVREGVTNVVRHSRATRCRITVTSSCLEVVDDGAPCRVQPGGSGLNGLRERAAGIGADVDASSSGAGFRLAVTVPA